MTPNARPPTWVDLDDRQRRRKIIAAGVNVIVTLALVVAIYYLLPFDADRRGNYAIRMIVGISALTVVVVANLKQVMRAEIPGLRAVHAVSVIIPLYLVTFAGVYVSLSQASSEHFSEPLNHTSALYFAVTVFATVGFGDITPRGDLPRAIVTVQMVLNLVLLGAVLRLLTHAVAVRRESLTSERSD